MITLKIKRSENVSRRSRRIEDRMNIQIIKNVQRPKRIFKHLSQLHLLYLKTKYLLALWIKWQVQVRNQHITVQNFSRAPLIFLVGLKNQFIDQILTTLQQSENMFGEKKNMYIVSVHKFWKLYSKRDHIVIY